MMLEQVIQQVTTLSFKVQRHPTQLIVDGTKGQQIFDAPTSSDDPELALRAVYNMGWHMAWCKGLGSKALELNAIGELLNVYYIEEGLLGSPVPLKSKRVAPSKDPNSIEAIRIDCFEAKEKKQHVSILEKVRGEHGELVNVVLHATILPSNNAQVKLLRVAAEMRYLSAFMDGFRAGSLIYT